MSFTTRLFIFLILNFAALGIGSLLMGNQVSGEWYQNLNKAPWTPPGWVFGAAWTTVMVTFSVFMAMLYSKANAQNILTAVLVIYAIQWILNVLWNGLFFRWHLPLMGLIEIILLLFTLLVLCYNGIQLTGLNTLWLAPYLLWLIVAISLNGYVVFNN